MKQGEAGQGAAAPSGAAHQELLPLARRGGGHEARHRVLQGGPAVPRRQARAGHPAQEGAEGPARRLHLAAVDDGAALQGVKGQAGWEAGHVRRGGVRGGAAWRGEAACGGEAT